MSTGYTYKLCEGKQSFEDFALQCARAFGACVMQRDDNPNDPPKLQEPSDHHFIQLEKAREELSKWENTSEEEASILAEEDYQKQKKEYLQMIQDGKAVRARLENMLEKVLAYEPPTEDHKEYKNFMIQQLELTLNHDGDFQYYVDALKNLKKQSGEQYKTDRIESAQHNIDYHHKHMKKEYERVDSRNEWIKKLYESLGREIK